MFCLLGGDRRSEDLYGVVESTFGLGGCEYCRRGLGVLKLWEIVVC